MLDDPGLMLRLLAPVIVAECGRPIVPGGASGTAFGIDIYVGDEFVSKWKPCAEGWIVLTMGDIAGKDPRHMTSHLKQLCTYEPTFEVHMWTPHERQDRGADKFSGSVRMSAFASMLRCVVRAIYSEHHGATSPNVTPFSRIGITRDPSVLRHGQQGILTFPVAFPVVAGQPLEVLPVGSEFGNVAVGDGHIIVNPEAP